RGRCADRHGGEQQWDVALGTPPAFALPKEEVGVLQSWIREVLDTSRLKNRESIGQRWPDQAALHLQPIAHEDRMRGSPALVQLETEGPHTAGGGFDTTVELQHPRARHRLTVHDRASRGDKVFDRGLLRLGSERGEEAEGEATRDERSPVHYSITSSARASTEGGIVRPRALAVTRVSSSRASAAAN